MHTRLIPIRERVFGLSLFFLLYPLTVVSSTTQDYLNRAKEQKLSETAQWERFLHIEKGIFGKKSEADTAKFFTSEATVDKPEEELLALVTGILEKSSPVGDDNYLCRFPARSKWLKEVLSIPDSYFDFTQCKRFNEYLQKHDRAEQSLSLIFSAYYLESPASAFGHTFFRFKKRGKSVSQENPTELLDTGLSYAANMTTDNALLYAILGMAGGFYGEYTILPYYYKIREYNDFESRDLWSYELNLTPEQNSKLLDHLWELGHTQFRYWYFTENCSYELLRLLEAVDPKLELVKKIPFYVIPVDTIKAVTQSDLVTKVEFRPSAKRKLDFFLKQLSKEEKTELFTMIKEKKDKPNLPDHSKVKVLDTLMQFIDFKHSKQIMNQKGENYEWKQKVLVERSNYPITGVNEVIPVPEFESPHLGHDSTRLGLAQGIDNELKGYADFNYRFAMHDVLDPRLGQPTHANLEFFDIHLRYYEEHRQLKIRDWTFVDVMTLNPWNEYQRPTTLKANVGLRRKPNPLCAGCEAVNAEVGGGVTLQFGQTTVFALGETDTSWSNEFKKTDIEFALGPSLNVLHAWNDTLLSLASFKYLHYIYAKRDWPIYNFETRKHFGTKWSVNAGIDIIDGNTQTQAGFYYYY